MSDYSVTLFEKAYESQVKFDYFLCSVAGALFAYIAQTYAPQKLDNAFSILQSISLIFLALSFYCGIKRIQTANLVIRLNQLISSASETAKEMTSVLNEGAIEKFKMFGNQISGERITREQLQSKRDGFLKEITEYRGQVQKTIPRSRIYSWLQINLLLAGFVIILTAKFLQPYQSDFRHPPSVISQPTNTTAQSPLETLPSKRTQ